MYYEFKYYMKLLTLSLYDQYLEVPPSHAPISVWVTPVIESL